MRDENEREYPINCRFEKFTNEPLLVFCDLDENISQSYYSIIFNTSSVYECEIEVKSTEYFHFTKEDADIPNLYSDIQIINVKGNEDTIEMKFNIISYHNEQLFITNESSFLLHLRIVK